MSALQLRARAALRKGHGRWLIPPWIAPAFLLCAIVLVPWTAFLFFALPRHYVANHWQLAWGGFDIGLGLALAATAVAVARSPFAEVTAAVAGTLLVCDAWFDVLTSRGMSDLVQAAAAAALVELPLAALCFWMATNLARAVEIARPFLRAAGFTSKGTVSSHRRNKRTRDRDPELDARAGPVAAAQPSGCCWAVRRSNTVTVS
jgi:hypothetical protein